MSTSITGSPGTSTRRPRTGPLWIQRSDSVARPVARIHIEALMQLARLTISRLMASVAIIALLFALASEGLRSWMWYYHDGKEQAGRTLSQMYDDETNARLVRDGQAALAARFAAQG